MTPNQIATNLALVAMADMNSKEQAKVATRVLARTIPAIQDFINGQFEVAGADPKTIFEGYRDFFQASLLSAGMVTVEEVSDQDIMDDPVEDDDSDEESEDDPFIIEESFEVSVAQLRELAAMEIRGKGKFIPLDDIEMPEEAKTKATTQVKVDGNITTKQTAPDGEPRRRNVMGKIGQ